MGCDGVVGCQGRCQLAGGCVKYGDGQWTRGGGGVRCLEGFSSVVAVHCKKELAIFPSPECQVIGIRRLQKGLDG